MKIEDRRSSKTKIGQNFFLWVFNAVPTQLLMRERRSFAFPAHSTTASTISDSFTSLGTSDVVDADLSVLVGVYQVFFIIFNFTGQQIKQKDFSYQFRVNMSKHELI